jgi:acyl-CoA reductase-like NAD-dependent aldehyde dehydrogenase
VFEDADIPSAVNGVAFAAFIASGQTCVSATRLLVHEQVYDRFMENFILKVKAITQGMGNREL